VGARLPATTSAPIEPGRIVAEHHFYSLTVTDLMGRQWTGQRVYVDRHSGPAGLILRGEAEDPIAGSLTLTISTDAEVTCNVVSQQATTFGDLTTTSSQLDTARFDACGCVCSLRRVEGHLDVRIDSEANLPEHIEMRMIEAMQFVLGRSLWWTLSRKTAQGKTHTCLRSERDRSRFRLDPPIQFRGDPTNAAVWKLCERYLKYIWHYPAERFHPISAWLHAVRDASTASAFAKGLALGVAIEGILADSFSTLGSPADDYLSKLASAREYMSGWNGDAALKGRIDGALGAITRPRAKDRLIALKEMGVATSDQIAAWDKLRNSAAHARPPEDDELQEWVDLCYRAQVLLHRLIFAAIGYAGEYTDYGAGWAKRTFEAQLPPEPRGLRPHPE
jgi:hypothetical protein